MGRGKGGTESDQLDDASEVHGAARVTSGLTILEVVAEYRALRASVLRLWQATSPQPNRSDLDDLTRFNEAIDQSMGRAVASFNKRLDASRKMFLAILGHDLRTPLAAITLSAKIAQMRASATPGLPELLTQILMSSDAISKLVTDLIDFTSSTMGVRLPTTAAPMDLATLCTDVVAETHAAHRGREVQCNTAGDLVGEWDAHRMRQVLTNLLGNAIQHGSPADPVTLNMDGSNPDTIVITVHNTGDPIPPQLLPTIFDPLVRGRTSVHERRTPGSIGLGLYIAREIVIAHRGTITLTSSKQEGTTATIRLPRSPSAPV